MYQLEKPDDAPTVLNPLADVITSEDASDLILYLADVFDDADNDNAAITKTVVSGNPSLVTVALFSNYLTLDFQPDQNGTATITVTGTSNGLAVTDSFTVTVSAVNDAPADLNSTAPLTIAENQSIGTVVGEFSATDPDAGASLFFGFPEELQITAHDQNRSYVVDDLIEANGSFWRIKTSFAPAGVYDPSSKFTYQSAARVSDGQGAFFESTTDFSAS